MSASLTRSVPIFFAAYRYWRRKRDERAMHRHLARLQEYREASALHDLERANFRNTK